MFISSVIPGRSKLLEERLNSRSDEEIATSLGLNARGKPEEKVDRTVETSECTSRESGHVFTMPRPLPFHEILLQRKPSYEYLDALCTRLDNMNLPVVPQAVLDDQGRTPLHIAASSKHCDSAMVARLLVGRYCDRWPAGAVDACGMTPLHCAVKSCPRTFKLFRSLHPRPKERKAIEKIKILVKAYPPALFMVNEDGHTPIALARHRKITNPDVLDLLWLSRTQMKAQLSQLFTRSTLSYGSASIGYSPRLPLLLEHQHCDMDTIISSLEFSDDDESRDCTTKV